MPKPKFKSEKERRRWMERQIAQAEGWSEVNQPAASERRKKRKKKKGPAKKKFSVQEAVVKAGSDPQTASKVSDRLFKGAMTGERMKHVGTKADLDRLIKRWLKHKDKAMLEGAEYYYRDRDLRNAAEEYHKETGKPYSQITVGELERDLTRRKGRMVRSRKKAERVKTKSGLRKKLQKDESLAGAKSSREIWRHMDFGATAREILRKQKKY